MKAICISCSDHYDTRMHGIIDFLTKKGYDIEYLISDFNHFTKSRYIETHGNAKQIHVPIYKKNISPQRIVSHYVFARKVLGEIKSFTPDLIYCMIPPNFLVKYVSKYKIKNSYCKVIFDVYDLWPESFPYKNNNPLIKKCFRIWAALRDNYITKADILIAVSEKGKETLDKKYSINSKVLRPFVKPEKISYYSENIDGEISFCYIGHVNHITDIDLGAEFLSKVAKKKNVTLHIIGEGQNKKQWIDILRNVGVKVIEHGVVFDEEEKKRIFSLCSMGLNIPRLEIASSLSLKSVEYMRFGIPFINSGIGDNKEMVIKEGVGINISRETIDDTVNNLLLLKQSDLEKMHKQCVDYYNKVFVNQDYAQLLEL